MGRIRSTSHRLSRAGLTLVAFLFLPVSADAVPIVTSVSGGSITAIGGGPADVGWEFSVNRQLLVTALGFWDPSALTPLRAKHEVGIWDLGGNLLADGTVLTDSPFTGPFRYVNVSPVVLHAGQTYRIAAFLPAFRLLSDADLFQLGNITIGANPAITVVRGVSSFSGQGFVFPTAAFGGNGIFGPDFQAVLLPEPATLTLLGLGLIAFAARRRIHGRTR